MQTTTERILQILLHWLDRFSDWFLRLSNQIANGVQRVYSWLQANLPEIPLSPFQWLMLIFSIVTLAYVWATPIFEAGQEIKHFAVIESFAQGELPVQDPDAPLYAEIGNEPPLYYALSSVIVAPLDLSNAAEYREPNRHVRVGDPFTAGNKNRVLRDTLQPPLEGAVIAVYALRLLNLAFAAVTLWAIYRTARLIAPQRPIAGLIAAGITALNPMFIFVTASVGNVPLAMMFNSVAIYLLLLMMRDGFAMRRSLALAVLIALAALTHVSGVVVLMIAILMGVWLARRGGNWRDFGVFLGALVVLFGIVAGWWYIRNAQLYGDVFGMVTAAQIAGWRSDEFTIGAFFADFQWVRLSFWGLFGASNIQASPLFYALVDFTVFLSIFGVIFLILQLLSIRDFSYARRELNGVLWVTFGFVVAFIAFLLWTAGSEIMTGWALFPYMGFIAPLLAIGFIEMVWWFLFLLSPPDRSFVRAGEAVPEPVLFQGLVWFLRALGLVAVLVPFSVIMPQYTPPQPIPVVPRAATPVYARFDHAELIAYSVGDRRYLPGEGVPVTFYWRVLEQTETERSLSIALIDHEGREIGKVDSFPGAGTLPVTSWQVGEIYPDRYTVNLDNTIIEQQAFRVHVSWWDGARGTPITPTVEGEALDGVILDAGAVVPLQGLTSASGFVEVPSEESAGLTFDESFKLVSYQFDSGLLELLLNWEATAPIDENYTVYAHILDDDGDYVEGTDIPPRLPTRYWRIGERFVIPLPMPYLEFLDPGEYTLVVGWYRRDEAGNIVRLNAPVLQPTEEQLATAQASQPDGIPPDIRRPFVQLLRVQVDVEGNVFIPSLQDEQNAVTPTADPPEMTPETTSETD